MDKIEKELLTYLRQELGGNVREPSRWLWFCGKDVYRVLYGCYLIGTGETPVQALGNAVKNLDTGNVPRKVLQAALQRMTSIRRSRSNNL
jgi:hypothetical protein